MDVAGDAGADTRVLAHLPENSPGRGRNLVMTMAMDRSVKIGKPVSLPIEPGEPEK